MPRKKQQKPELEATELPVELPLEVVETEPKIVSPIRRQVRPVPDTEWGALVTAMRDYVTSTPDKGTNFHFMLPLYQLHPTP